MATYADEKGPASEYAHVEYDQQLEQDKAAHADAHAHIDIHEAAARGHVATDEKGNPLIEIDQAASHRLALKIDRWIIPVVAIQYLLAFIDRANIGNARLAGLEKDLHLKGYDYNILLSIFYVSYIVFEIPANLFTKWLGPGKCIPLYTFLFGILSLATAFVTNLGTGCAVRFLLGISEAGMLPGIAYYLSRWYTKDELVFRLSLYIVCAPLAGAFGGLLASGILTLDRIGTVHTWRLIFLIEGIITAGVGIICYFIMTDRPATAKWLTEEEKGEF
jgi:MFS family permease